MKFSGTSVPPASLTPQPIRPNHTRDRLGENLFRHLSEGPACFDFMVQPRLVPEHMPIEDPTVPWRESESAFVRVATLTFLSGYQIKAAGENLSFFALAQPGRAPTAGRHIAHEACCVRNHVVAPR